MNPRDIDSLEAQLKICTTERDAMRASLAELFMSRSDLLRGVLEYLPDPAVQISLSHQVLWANREMLRMVPDAVGKLCYDVLCRRNGPRTDCPCIRALESGRFEAGTVQIQREDSPEYWEKIGVPIIDPEGKPTSVIEISRNITERENCRIQMETMARELKVAQESAESAKLAKSQFISNTSHEIRTPMNGIMGMIQLLERTALQEDQQELLKHLKASAERLMNVVDGILDISTLERDGMTLIEEEFNLADWLKYTVASKEKAGLAKGLTLEHRVVPGAPEQIITDKYRLTQAVSNIIDNSIKFSRVGNIEIIGDCKVDENKAPMLSIRISDGGIGIPEDKLDSIFDSFSQADGSSTREFGGAGLGLSISRRIVERMNGRIEVQSVYGVGTTFVVYLPVQLSEFEKNKPALQPAPQTAEPPEAYGTGTQMKRILVAEDEMLGRITMKFMLKDRYEVIFAKNGREAVERYVADRPDLVLMDIMMPQMNGFEAFDEIEKQSGGNRVPIIACTAKVIKTEREYLISYGFDDYLSKPVDMKKLNQILEKYLNPSGASE